MTDVQQDIGYLKGRVDSIEATVSEIRNDMKTVVAHIEQSKGARRTWKSIVTLSTIFAGLFEIIRQLWPHK